MNEDKRTGIEHVRQGAGIILGIGRNLGTGLVTGRLHELLELTVRHRRAVDPEAVDRHAMDRRFLRIMIVGTHAEVPPGIQTMSSVRSGSDGRSLRRISSRSDVMTPTPDSRGYGQTSITGIAVRHATNATARAEYL